MAISSKDIETLWERYSAEEVKRDISVTQFFESNGVPYRTFKKWYKQRFQQPSVVDCVVAVALAEIKEEVEKQSLNLQKAEGRTAIVCM